MQDRELRILIANDAAGEGVNLQRGHLTVNYDLPWNPNKIEQRFGRIPRIGQTGTDTPLQKHYKRICFDKGRINRQPVATFVCPGHPLLEAVIGLIREQYEHLMKQGALLVDDTDPGEDLQAVFLLEHGVRDGRVTATGKPHLLSQRLQFAAVDRAGHTVNAGIAPHLNLRPATPEEIARVQDKLSEDWLTTELEPTAVRFATVELAQAHVTEVRARRLPEIDKVEQEVRGRIDGADTVMITRQEIITSLHAPDKFILAIVRVGADGARPPRYVCGALDEREPCFDQTAVQYHLNSLLARAETPG